MNKANLDSFYEGKGSRRRSSSTAAPHSGQSYPSSGGSASLRKTSVNSTGYEAGNQYRKEAGYKNSQLDKWWVLRKRAAVLISQGTGGFAQTGPNAQKIQ